MKNKKIEAEKKLQENKETEVKPEVTTNQENKIELTDAKEEASQIETKKPEMPQQSQQTIEKHPNVADMEVVSSMSSVEIQQSSTPPIDTSEPPSQHTHISSS